jgi:K+-transporting ATPase KdpF subunit
MPAPASGCEVDAMSYEYVIGLVVSAGVCAYLVYALLRPERF